MPGADASCRISDIRLGGQFHYHFGRPHKPDPWIGLGAGYEWITLKIRLEEGDEEATLSTTGRGVEFLNFQGGVDFHLGDTTALGPFLTWTLSRYDHASVSCGGDCGDLDDSESQEIEEKALHYWIIVGAGFSLFP